MATFQHVLGLGFAMGALSLGTFACGPHHHGGGSGGEAGNGEAGAPSGEGGTAGTSAGTAGSAGDTASGGVAGSGGVTGSSGAAGTSGAGGAEPATYGYDYTIGCDGQPWPSTAMFSILAEPSLGYQISSLSGDGRVIGGRYNDHVSMRHFVAERHMYILGTFGQLTGYVTQLSCDGAYGVVWDGTYGIIRHSHATNGFDIVFAPDEYPEVVPRAISPDGSVVLGTMNDPRGAGPFSLRWTAETGAERLPGLDNTLVFHVYPDDERITGLDIGGAFVYSDQNGKKRIPTPHPEQTVPATVVVSADGSTQAYNVDATHLVWNWAFNQPLTCPDGLRCRPIDLSGTGKVMLLAAGDELNPNQRFYIWDRYHDFREITALLTQYGAPTLPSSIVVQFMSDDAQVFVGSSFDGPFYATLPPRIYQ